MGGGFHSVKSNERLYFPIYKDDGNVVIVESDGTAENTNEVVNLNDYLDNEIGSVFLHSIEYKENIIFSVRNRMYYKLNLKTMDLTFIEKLDVVSDHYRLEKFDESLYMKYGTENYYYFNDYRNKFEEIEPNVTDVPLYSIHTNKILFKDHLYFIADYYSDGHKLYRIDNTFQTVSSVETQPTEEVNLYPNPTGDMLNISVDEPTRVSIIDLTGKVVMSIDNYNGERINTSDLSAGVYNIILDENTHGGKFVKE
ncbi:MAG: T9SS type A sorting domain-containing protein [Chlorobiota bacterium]